MKRSEEAAESCQENEVWLSTRNKKKICQPAPKKSSKLSSFSFVSKSTQCSPPAPQYQSSIRDFLMTGRVTESNDQQNIENVLTREDKMAYNSLQKTPADILPRKDYSSRPPFLCLHKQTYDSERDLRPLSRQHDDTPHKKFTFCGDSQENTDHQQKNICSLQEICSASVNSSYGKLPTNPAQLNSGEHSGRKLFSELQTDQIADPCLITDFSQPLSEHTMCTATTTTTTTTTSSTSSISNELQLTQSQSSTNRHMFREHDFKILNESESCEHLNFVDSEPDFTLVSQRSVDEDTQSFDETDDFTFNSSF